MFYFNLKKSTTFFNDRVWKHKIIVKILTSIYFFPILNGRQYLLVHLYGQICFKTCFLSLAMIKLTISKWDAIWSGGAMLAISGVNFINVCTNFAYERRFSSYVLALSKNSYKKFAHLTLMKLTAGGAAMIKFAMILPFPNTGP